MWATFMKINENYLWPGMYKDATHFVEHVKVVGYIQAYDLEMSLHPAYPLAIPFEWMVDIVVTLAKWNLCMLAKMHLKQGVKDMYKVKIHLHYDLFVSYQFTMIIIS